MSERLPSQWEQDVAEAHVNDRVLNRPEVHFDDAISVVVVFVSASILLTGLATSLLHRITAASIPSRPIMLTMFVFVTVLLTVVAGPVAVVRIIRVYQRYAPESVRRRCLFMPTCSEYAILALLRYGLLGGTTRTAVRLFRRCRGNIYRIDYP